MKKAKSILVLSILGSSLLYGSGYRIPEQSVKSVALSAAYVANTSGADSAYFNPANMIFDENINQIEASLTNINVSSTKYTDNVTSVKDSESKKESPVIPGIFFSSKDYDGIRYGFALTVPGGLSKRWDSAFAKATAEEFTLEIVELNPTIAYKMNKDFAISAGIRVIKSDGIVKSDSAAAKRDMKADSIDYGYNLALAYKVDQKSRLGATYRSKVILTLSGKADLSLAGTLYPNLNASVDVVLPAVASLAYAYDITPKTTLEFEFDRTYWSKYKELDFEFDVTNPATTAFGAPIEKNWHDSDAYRLGVTHKYNNKLTILAAIAKDQTPIPEKTIGFELPDSDAMIYSTGFTYKHSDKLTYGLGLLYEKKDNRSVKNTKIDGDFKDTTVTMISCGLSYKFK